MNAPPTLPAVQNNVVAISARDAAGTGVTSPRIPPHNYEAEQALLGSMMVNNHVYERVSEFLRAEHFADPANGRIYSAAARLIERGQLANPVTLKSYLAEDPIMQEAGGVSYLLKLVENNLGIISAVDFARVVHDSFVRRELIDLGHEVVNRAFEYKVDETAVTQIEQAERYLYDLATVGETEGGLKPFGQSVQMAIEQAEAAFKRDGQLAGLGSGFGDLDNLLGGLHRSDLIILAGRPSMGKTALATNMAFHIAQKHRTEKDALGQHKTVDGGIVGFFSLEMSAEQLATRIMAEVSQLPSEKIRRGDLSSRDFEKVIEASQTLHGVPLFIDDTPSLSVSALRTRARRLQRQRGLSLIVVDYLQLMNASFSGKGDNRVQEITEISRGLKAIAKELNVPVIALSQLSRQVENRDDKRPQLSDLRESGSIEQDADVVMFVYREQYYLERAEPNRRADETEEKFNDRYENWRKRLEEVIDLAEVIVAKQRHGPIGKVTLRFDGRSTKFSDYASDSQLPAHY